MSERIDNGVHLPIAETRAVGLFGTFMYACPVGNVGRLCGV